MKDIDVYYQAAINKGITHLIVVGYDLKSSLDALSLAERFPAIYAAVGIHPNDLLLAKKADFEAIEKLLDHPKVVALGEIGLDYYWNKVDKATQKYYFEYFIKMAYRKHKPIIIHNRDADFDTLSLLREHKAYLSKGVMHCYSASKEMVKDFIDVGMYISFAGPLTFLNAKAPKAAAQEVPLDKILIETDAPYLAPHPLRGKQNQPAYVTYVAEELARLLNKPLADVANITSHNAKVLFGLPL
jgi:TatD DNase family protein